MFFGKKNKCARCKSDVKEEFSFCPYCGLSMVDKEKEMRDFGMLGRNDSTLNGNEFTSPEMKVADRLISTLMGSLAKNLDEQFKNAARAQGNSERAEIKALPNGISIRIGPAASPQGQPKQPRQRAGISEEQIQKLSSMPRAKAKTKVRRVGDRVVYELAASGISSPKDVFISRLESGYEIKAIGGKKVYVNTIPVSLPIHGFSFDANGLYLEFLSQTQ